MSQENVEVVRRSIELWNDGQVEASIDLSADDAELQTDPRFIEGGAFRGRDELLRWSQGLRDGWVGGGSVITTEFIEVGDRVVVTGEWRGTGETSGIEASLPVTVVFTVHGGKIQRTQYFLDHEEALKAVGLQE
jgi:ketosteroid isomerase-like protein